MATLWNVVFLVLSALSIEAGSLVGDFPTYKTWWGRQVLTPNIYTAGKLTVSQIKYVREAGFPSMIAMFHYTKPVYIGEEVVPTGDQETVLARDVLGMQFQHVLPPGANNWQSLDTVRTFAAAYETFEKPVMFHCGSSYSATATVLMYFLNQTKHFPEARPKVDLDEFFKQSAAMGLDYGSDAGLMDLVRQIMGTADIEVTTRPNVTLPKWNKKYWLVRAIHDNWYAAGQGRSNYMSMMQNFDVVINLRDGTTTPREEVTLLNVKDDTGVDRQTKENLERDILEPNRANSYIGPNSTVNYQSRNHLEFGDGVGYNEGLEKQAMTRGNVEYYNLPVGEKDGAMNKWRRHKEVLLRLGSTKNSIIIHSRNAEDAVMLSLLSAGCKHGYGSDWALEKAARLGFNWQLLTHYDVITTIKLVLNRPTMC